MVETSPSHWWLAIRAVDLFVLGLATWRISSMIVEETGPFHIFQWVRFHLGVRYTTTSEPFGTNALVEALTCVWCFSVWVGLFVGLAYAFAPSVTMIVCGILSLSTLAVIIEEIVGDD